MSTMFYLFHRRTFDFMFYERRTIKKHKKGEYNGASHSFRAVIVKQLHFALWLNVAITHFDVIGVN